MDHALRKLLDEHDDATGCEVPGNDWSSFPHQKLAESVRRIQEALRDELGLVFAIDGAVQDASFHDELHVLHPQSFRSNGVVAIVPEIAIRFSNFGHLYTIHSGVPEALGPYPLDEIRALVTRHGWTYVPADDLGEVYDGRNETLRDGRNTWWIRFFDYL